MFAVLAHSVFFLFGSEDYSGIIFIERLYPAGLDFSSKGGAQTLLMHPDKGIDLTSSINGHISVNA